MPRSSPLADIAAAEIRAEMARQRKSAVSLAAELGVSDMYLSRRLHGHIPFDLSDLEKIATALAVPVSALLDVRAESAA